MQLWNKIFQKILVLSLPDSKDRQRHIQNEFQRVGIEKYDFFYASSPTSSEFQEMKKKYVKKMYQCFRCHQKVCFCENNYLTDFQIANWTSFIRMWQYIVDQQIPFTLICEDDIVFTPRHQQIIFRLFNKSVFQHHQIDMQKPLCIGLGSAYNIQKHFSKKVPQLKRVDVMCNPCFCINLAMAKLFLENISIQHTSDHYMHVDIPAKFPFVQHYVMTPWPVYELSFVPQVQRFESLIRPNGKDRRREFVDFLFCAGSDKSIPLFFSPLLDIWNLPKKTCNSALSPMPCHRNYYCYFDDYFQMSPQEREKKIFRHTVFFNLGKGIYDFPFDQIVSIYDISKVMEVLEMIYKDLQLSAFEMIQKTFPSPQKEPKRMSDIQRKDIENLIHSFIEKIQT